MTSLVPRYFARMSSMMLVQDGNFPSGRERGRGGRTRAPTARRDRSHREINGTNPLNRPTTQYQLKLHSRTTSCRLACARRICNLVHQPAKTTDIARVIAPTWVPFDDAHASSCTSLTQPRTVRCASITRSRLAFYYCVSCLPRRHLISGCLYREGERTGCGKYY